MKVLVTGRLPKEVMTVIMKDHVVEMHEDDRPMDRGRLLDLIGDKDGLLCMITDRIDGEVLAKAPQLKMIANVGVGYDNIDVAAATSKGIPVSNTPDVLTDATADLTFALILSTARRVVEGDKRTRAGKFRFWAPLHFLGREVSRKTLGIIGLGRIGKAVAKRARGFDMQVLYYSRTRLKSSEEKELGLTYKSLKGLLERSDFVSLHVPLSEKTRYLIGPGELEIMKPTAFLINTSRGPVVDERSLIEALRKRKIAGAGLDVYEDEPSLKPGMKELENVVLLPHIGSATIETRTMMGLKAAENLVTGLRGDRPPECLNCEDISNDRTG
jgi:glyoxylate reductase